MTLTSFTTLESQVVGEKKKKKKDTPWAGGSRSNKEENRC